MGRWVRVGVALVAAWPVVAWIAARALVVHDETTSADVIVVLSGASEYVERTRYAAELWRQGVAPKIVLTNDDLRGGWDSKQQRNPYFVEREAAELRRAGVPEAQIEALPEPVASTYDEAVRVRAYAVERKLASVVVVTSAYHSRRARWTFRRVVQESGVRVSVAPVAAGTEQTPPAYSWWLTARGWRSVAPEYPKLVYYGLRYR
ncbi:MAG TPA: YdcF family protein [Pyrinomonadaceae bacterium]|nr:YdcF family protein [Pyrinomonadaceae bacterium]